MAESQKLVCTGCEKTLRIPSKYWGKKVRCPQCQEVLTVPAGAAAAGGVKQASPAPAKTPTPSGTLDDVDFIEDAGNPYADDPFADLPDQSEFAAPPRTTPKKRTKKSSSGGAFRAEKGMLGAGVLGGLALMAVAVIWFVGGLFAGYIFYYPPFMFIFGFIAMIKGFIRKS